MKYKSIYIHFMKFKNKKISWKHLQDMKNINLGQKNERVINKKSLKELYKYNHTKYRKV